MAKLDTDIAIIGAGAAGCLFAAKLAAAGREVDVFEAGPARTRDDLVSSQIWARRLKWGGPSMRSDGAPRFAHNFNMGWGTGGAALHHYAQYPRLLERDFKTASLFGMGLDWPIDHQDLRPHYDAVQAEIGIAGDAAREQYRPPGEPYPMPPHFAFAGARLMAQGFQAQGYQVFPTPLAVTSTPYRDRPACIYDGWCDAGCPTGALANPLVTYWPSAQKAGARLHPKHDVIRFELAPNHKRVEAALIATDRGETVRVRARNFILAAGAVHNARVLLSSPGIDGAALGNRHDVLGTYFGSHIIANTHALFGQETEPYLGLSTGSLMTYDLWQPDSGAPFGSIAWGIGAAIKPNDFMGLAMARADLFGAALDAFMRRASHHIGLANGICETAFLRESRIRLTDSVDRQGRRQAHIGYRADAEANAMWARAVGRGLDALRAAGAEEVWAGDRPVLAHAMGGTVMGHDPANAVTDAFGRLFEAPNLVVAGSSLFPAGGSAGPTFTILALARRTALELIARPETF